MRSSRASMQDSSRYRGSSFCLRRTMAAPRLQLPGLVLQRSPRSNTPLRLTFALSVICQSATVECRRSGFPRRLNAAERVSSVSRVLEGPHSPETRGTGPERPLLQLFDSFKHSDLTSSCCCGSWSSGTSF